MPGVIGSKPPVHGASSDRRPFSPVERVSADHTVLFQHPLWLAGDVLKQARNLSFFDQSRSCCSVCLLLVLLMLRLFSSRPSQQFLPLRQRGHTINDFCAFAARLEKRYWQWPPGRS
eukprot:SAG11_NODE_404_length_9736_cov_20.243022_10_plen_117_part_00